MDYIIIRESQTGSMSGFHHRPESFFTAFHARYRVIPRVITTPVPIKGKVKTVQTCLFIDRIVSPGTYNTT